MTRIPRAIVQSVVVLSIASVLTVVADDFTIDRSTIDGGGGMRSTGGDFDLSGTIGQPDAGALLTGGGFEVTGGFWFRVVTGDANGDGIIDLFDYQQFVDCLNGPGGDPLPPECGNLDSDDDGDTDLADWGEFQKAFTGGA